MTQETELGRALRALEGRERRETERYHEQQAQRKAYPLLLAACEAALNFLNPDEPGWLEMRDQLHAAIGAAKGQDQEPCDMCDAATLTADIRQVYGGRFCGSCLEVYYGEQTGAS